MTEDLLDQAQAHPGGVEVRRVRMAQRVHRRVFGDPALEDRAPERTLETAARDGPALVGQAVTQAVARRGRDQPLARAMGAPIVAQPREDRRGQGDVAIPFAFAVNVEQHPPAVDIGDLAPRALEQSQSTGIDRGQALAVDRDPHQGEHPPNLVAAEHRRPPRRGRGAHEPERRPGLLQRLLVQEPDRTERDGGGGARDLLLVGQVQEVLAQLLLGQVRRTGVDMLGELADSGDVALLGPCGQPPELHILQHPLTSGRHAVAPSGERE